MPVKRILTARQKQIVQDNYLLMPSRQLAKKVGRGTSKFFICQYLSVNGLIVPKETIGKWRSESLRGNSTSTLATDRKLKKFYLFLGSKALAKKVKRSSSFVITRLRQLGLEVPQEVKNQRSLDSRIKPGNISHNKGRKISDWMTPAQIRKIKKTQFKKGNLPHNTKHDLAVSIRPDKRGVKMLFIRIGLGNWKPLHRYNWEQVHGPIAKGLNLIFKDRNAFNCNAGNLELLTNAELMRRNSFWANYPAPIGRIIQLQGALSRQINKHLKNIQNAKKQNQRSA